MASLATQPPRMVLLLLMLAVAVAAQYPLAASSLAVGGRQQDRNSGARQYRRGRRAPTGNRDRAPTSNAQPANTARMGNSCRKLRTNASPELSEFGKKVRTIVLAGLGGGGVCDARTGDWRANLPKFLGAYAGADVIVYDPRQRSCRTCYSARKAANKMSCQRRLDQGVDLLFLIGSGKIGGPQSNCAPGSKWCPRQFTDLSDIMQRRWAGRANRTVHFPIRNLVRLVNNQVFHFDVIIEDGSFAKPPGRCVAEYFQRCRGTATHKTLVYIGRIMGAKGQLEFLRRADAKLLKGYTIQFFGRPQNPEYGRAVKTLALHKGIRAVFAGEVSKEELAKHMCQAEGIIMYSMDKNPRSIYEGVQAGLPVFVSEEAQVAPSLTAQPFVFEVSRAASQATFDEQLARYMDLVEAGGWSARIHDWAKTELTMDAVYTGLCQRMGVCADGKQKYDPWFGGDEGTEDSGVQRRRRYRRSNMLKPSTYKHGREKVLTTKAKLKLIAQRAA